MINNSKIRTYAIAAALRPVSLLLRFANNRVRMWSKTLTPLQRKKTKRWRESINFWAKYTDKYARAYSSAGLVKKTSSRTSSRLTSSVVNRNIFKHTEIFDFRSDVVALPSGFVPHRGLHPFGLWQFNFLKANGLEKHNVICDIGCGDMREGVPLIKYLDKGCYIGYDQSQSALSQGIASISDSDLRIKSPTLLWGYDFNLADCVGRDIVDLVWANSVWTHLDLSAIVQSMEAILLILKPRGKFMATFFDVGNDKYVNPRIYRDCSNIDSRINLRSTLSTLKAKKSKLTYPNRNPYHYPSLLLIKLATCAGYKHASVHTTLTPKGQSILVLSK
jgi:hypothetical protein